MIVGSTGYFNRAPFNAKTVARFGVKSSIPVVIDDPPKFRRWTTDVASVVFAIVTGGPSVNKIAFFTQTFAKIVFRTYNIIRKYSFGSPAFYDYFISSAV